jgi:hypothetical protein
MDIKRQDLKKACVTKWKKLTGMGDITKAIIIKHK